MMLGWTVLTRIHSRERGGWGAGGPDRRTWSRTGLGFGWRLYCNLVSYDVSILVSYLVSYSVSSISCAGASCVLSVVLDLIDGLIDG